VTTRRWSARPAGAPPLRRRQERVDRGRSRDGVREVVGRRRDVRDPIRRSAARTRPSRTCVAPLYTVGLSVLPRAGGQRYLVRTSPAPVITVRAPRHRQVVHRAYSRRDVLAGSVLSTATVSSRACNTRQTGTQIQTRTEPRAVPRDRKRSTE
jgi:hypothetical protein